MRMTLGIIATAGVALGLGLWALSPKADSTEPTQGQAQSQARSQADEVSVLTVEGMTCGGCAAAVKMAATGVDGVKDATVSFEEGRAEVTYDASKTTPEVIAQVVSEKSGFKATVATKPPLELTSQ